MVPSTASLLVSAVSLLGLVTAAPAKRNNGGKLEYEGYYDVQGHRGARGESVESTLSAFAHGMMAGATTMELDNGITKDGAVVVWHDESIDGAKCKDTAPVTADDPMYPYVGKYIANLTLAQIKTLDCGSQRLQNFPQQLRYPGEKLSTLQEFFNFVECTNVPFLYNIESKVDPVFPNYTGTPEDFVEKQLAIFKDYNLVHRITYQSFDWRTLVLANEQLPELTLSALFDDTTFYARIGEPDATSGPSDWLAGLDLADFKGSTPAAQAVNAAYSIGANIVSPGAQVVNSANYSTAPDPSYEGYESLVNASMVSTAHGLGMKVKPYTINSLFTVEQLDSLGVDGIITDYPEVIRRWADQKGYKVAPKIGYEVVNKCFKKYAQFHGEVPNLL